MSLFLSLLAGFGLPQAPEAEKPEGLPLEVAEVLEFQVDEGTWMSLDVSPDGSVGGKIHRIDFATGESRVVPFTAKVAAEIGPRVHFRGRVDDSDRVRARVIRWPSPSPDGTRLAFGAFNHVWISPLPGGAPPRRLTKLETPEFMPTWSPDGRTVVFVTWSTEGGHLYRAAADGSGEPERLTDHPAFYADPGYSPDGSKIVFVTGAVSDQLYSFLAEDLVYRDFEIGGVSPTGALDLRYSRARTPSAT